MNRRIKPMKKKIRVLLKRIQKFIINNIFPELVQIWWDFSLHPYMVFIKVSFYYLTLSLVPRLIWHALLTYAVHRAVQVGAKQYFGDKYILSQESLFSSFSLLTVLVITFFAYCVILKATIVGGRFVHSFFMKILYFTDSKQSSNLFFLLASVTGVTGTMAFLYMRLVSPGLLVFNTNDHLSNVLVLGHSFLIIFIVMPAAINGAVCRIVPLQIGAVGMALPRTSNLCFWMFLSSFLLVVGATFGESEIAKGWAIYLPWPISQYQLNFSVRFFELCSVSMLLSCIASLLGVINFICTIVLNKRNTHFNLYGLSPIILLLLTSSISILLSTLASAESVTVLLFGGTFDVRIDANNTLLLNFFRLKPFWYPEIAIAAFLVLWVVSSILSSIMDLYRRFRLVKVSGEIPNMRLYSGIILLMLLILLKMLVLSYELLTSCFVIINDWRSLNEQSNVLNNDLVSRLSHFQKISSELKVITEKAEKPSPYPLLIIYYFLTMVSLAVDAFWVVEQLYRFILSPEFIALKQLELDPEFVEEMTQRGLMQDIYYIDMEYEDIDVLLRCYYVDTKPFAKFILLPENEYFIPLEREHWPLVYRSYPRRF